MLKPIAHVRYLTYLCINREDTFLTFTIILILIILILKLQCMSLNFLLLTICKMLLSGIVYDLFKQSVSQHTQTS